MFWNFIKGALRNIATYKTFTTINILGLSIGITCALIISLYVVHETSYDNFHSKPENIYRIVLDGQLYGIKAEGAMTTGAMSRVLAKDSSVFKEATRIARFGAWLVSHDTIRDNEDDILFVDPNFFSFFDGFKLIEGNADEVVKYPHSFVLTESAALKYFGTTDVVGQNLLVEAGRKFKITGVMADPPSNTHIPFSIIGSLVTYENLVDYWTKNDCYNYVKLKPGYTLKDAKAELKLVVNKFILPEFYSVFDDVLSKEDSYVFKLQPLRDIHLKSALDGELGVNSKDEYVYAFGIAAILILIIACLNFMNLSTANSINRSKEVILRKVTGAQKIQIVQQFLTESISFSFIALAIALLLTEIALPAFNTYLGLGLKFHFLSNMKAVGFIVALTLVVGFISGFYPAIFISSFNPVNVLQGKLGQGLRNSSVRAVFVVFQFFISVLIISITLVVYKQMNFMLRKDLGFDSEQVVIIRRSDALKKNTEIFKRELLQNKDIISVTNSNAIPGRDFTSTTFSLAGMESNSAILINQVFVNFDFEKTYNLQLETGRFFDSTVKSDVNTCIINESAAKILGLSYPVGHVLKQPSLLAKTNRQYQIIGVVKDFHFQSVDKPVQPLVICMMPGYWEGFINVKLTNSNINKSLGFIEKHWNKYAPDYPFVYFFLNKDFERNYDAIRKIGRIFIVFSILAVFLATLGLYGLISYSFNHRMREIGIRKSLGASNTTLVTMLSLEAFKLVSVSAVFAWGASWFIAQKWLNTFPYRIKVEPMILLFSALLVLAIALATVVLRAMKYVRKQPGAILKYE
ncbi:MAG: ABC transporter permease [Bacteroidales bacterium]|nr:ABC transporter permease [Bacteroidales bacterium]MBN2817585.1 ABC transporter permease [Bacteroidales bacterium]